MILLFFRGRILNSILVCGRPFPSLKSAAVVALFLLCEQSKMARMKVEGPPVKAVPESTRRRPTPQSSPNKAVPEGMRSRALPPPEGTPLQLRPTWTGPPKEPPAEVNATEVEDAKRDLEFDAKHIWNLRERVIIRAMEKYFAKARGEILVEVGELEAHLL